MKVQISGNNPSTAVAIYGPITAEGEKEIRSDPCECLEKNFYVNRLKPLPTEQPANHLLKRSQDGLTTANLRLHKTVLNSDKVTKAFPSDDHAVSLKGFELGTDLSLTPHSLGLLWDLKQDTFMFQVSSYDKPFMKREMLAVNCIDDPPGLIASFTVQGKILLSQLNSDNTD